MKVCPTCQKTYTDENLNFCLEDGTTLKPISAAPPPPADTVLVNQTRMTPPGQSTSGPSGGPTSPGGGAGASGGWGSAPQQPYSMQPPAAKSSKTWVWVVGILAVVVLVCGGGLVGFFAWVASLDNNKNYTITNTNTRTTGTNSGTKGPNSTNNPKYEDAEEIDLSGWVQRISIYGNTEFTDGEFLVKCNPGYGYYVLLAAKDLTSEDAITTVTVRNVDDVATERGFGLVFHSDPSPLQKDYAFLIDSRKKRYRVVRHEPQKELVVVKWTNFAAIKNGTEANVLEVKDEGENLSLSINGQQATTIPDTYGYKNGAPGLYTSGSVRAAFSAMQIKK